MKNEFIRTKQNSCVLKICSKKIKKRLRWILEPEQSLYQLISSYLLSQIKHMQQGKQSKSQGGKGTTKK